MNGFAKEREIDDYLDERAAGGGGEGGNKNNRLKQVRELWRDERQESALMEEISTKT